MSIGLRTYNDLSRVGVVQNLPFLGYTDRVETARL